MHSSKFRNASSRFKLLGIACLTSCLMSCQPASDSAQTAEGSSAKTAPEVKSGEPTLHPLVSKSILIRDYQNARFSFVLKFTNQTDETAYMSLPFLRLVTTAGDNVPLFLLPSTKITEVRSGKTADVALRFWLDPKHLQSGLVLHLGEDQQIELKSNQPFDLTQLENGKEHELQSVNW